MPCFVPFNSKNLDISLFVFRPSGSSPEDLVDALKYFCLSLEDLGCAYSAILKSIHGNLVICYGAWRKRSDDKLKLLETPLMSSLLTDISGLASIVELGFFDPYCGESKDGFPAAKFSSGDILSISSVFPTSDKQTDLSYACLALLRSYFSKIQGISASVCFNSCNGPSRVVCLLVWKSLRSCYSWLLDSDYRGTIQSFISDLSINIKHDVFRVDYVSGDDKIQHFPSSQQPEGSDGGDQEG